MIGEEEFAEKIAGLASVRDALTVEEFNNSAPVAGGGNTMRVLVTGSRDWAAECRVWEELDLCMVDAAVNGVDVTVVHGDCPEGADRMARNWAERHRTVGQFLSDYRVGVSEERHPADWRRFGRKAGPVRNTEMVGLGADLCLAFIRRCIKMTCPLRSLHGSHGASQTAREAREAGIEVREFREGW